MNKNIQISTSNKKIKSKGSDQTIQKTKQVRRPKNSGSYIKKYEEHFFYMRPPDKKFFDTLAEDYLSWALKLSEDIYSGELKPDIKWHPLTCEYFVISNGINVSTWGSWLKDNDQADSLRSAHGQVLSILGNIREAAALWNHGNAGHIQKTLGHYSKAYRQEQERLSNLNVDDKDHTKRATIIVNIPEVRSESGNSNMAQ